MLDVERALDQRVPVRLPARRHRAGAVRARPARARPPHGAGFVPVIPPVLVREEAMFGSGFLPTDEVNIYVTSPDELYLVGTSEVSLAAFHAGEILDEADLPIRYAGYSTCFRREAGTYGKDMGGMFRVHQFDKVEMFSFARPEESWDELEFILGIEEEIVGTLDVPYRVVNVAAGDLGSAAAKKYDLEAWLPGRAGTGSSPRARTTPTTRDVGRPGSGGPRGGRGAAHAERHGHRDRPDADRDPRELPACGWRRRPAHRSTRTCPRASASSDRRASRRRRRARRTPCPRGRGSGSRAPVGGDVHRPPARTAGCPRRPGRARRGCPATRRGHRLG